MEATTEQIAKMAADYKRGWDDWMADRPRPEGDSEDYYEGRREAFSAATGWE